MELKWWPVLVAGFACLAVGIACAALLPMRQARLRLRPLAHVDRLTRLPEYTRAVRLQFWSMLLMVVLLVILFLQALLTSSRPAGLRTMEAAQPEDIMLCVGAPVTDQVTAGLLDHFAQRTVNFDTQRIGLTSASLRVVPLTRDYQYAADEFSRLAKLAALQQNVDTNVPMAAGEAAELRSGLSEFSQPLNYVDYARSTADVLALCMAGFPADKTNRVRSLIYLGPTDFRRPDEVRPSLFSAAQVDAMASAGAIQVNVLTPAAGSPPGGEEADDRGLRAVAAATGGRFEVYAPGAAIDGALERIRAATVAGASATTRQDTPDVPLIGGIVVSVLLCISLAVLRR